ncbi:CsbD family protein [Streptomyces sp. NPDC004561]
MAASEKARAKVEQAVGKAAQAAGHAVGNDKLIAKGHAAQAAGEARERKESLKDTGHH